MSDDWEQRLTGQLEPILMQPDPRPQISAYHDMPYAIFRYSPEDEFAVRKGIALLRTRLQQAGKRVTTISLAECMTAGLETENLGPAELADTEMAMGLQATVETVHEILSSYQPLDNLVAQRLPEEPGAEHDIVFIVRAGALFPMYRTSSLLEQLKGKVPVPAVLFYPGELDGAAGLRFMGVLEAEHNYRPKIF
jgi:Domain of unknown function (DUF1788)